MPEVIKFNTYVCSFCGRNSKQVEFIIATDNKIGICDQCIDVCNETLKLKRAGYATNSKTT